MNKGLIVTWIGGYLARRRARVLGIAGGIALTTAMIAALGSFLYVSAGTMTSTAIASLPVDWQLEFPPDVDRQSVEEAVHEAAKPQSSEWVAYADTSGLEAQTQGTLQKTGPGKVIGVSPSYWQKFQGQLRLLAGSMSGSLLAQQTAANLHAGPGDRITIERIGLSPVTLAISGIVDLPNADSMFQSIAVAPTAAPQAPPDNVVIQPIAEWEQNFTPQSALRPDTVRYQLHLTLDHGNLPSAPAQAYERTTAMAHNLEAKIAGSGVIGNNLAARLEAVREDALYTSVLFLFLGAPGAILAMMMTFAVTAAGDSARRTEQALLRARGASLPDLLTITGMEGLVSALIGIVLGWFLAALLAAFLLAEKNADIGLPLGWLLFAAFCGLSVALIGTVAPAWRSARHLTIFRQAKGTRAAKEPVSERIWLDLALLAVSGVVFWQLAGTGYQIVLAPEGVAATAVDYKAFIAPLLFWLGAILLARRLCRLSLRHGKRLLEKLIRPVAGTLSGIVASSIARRSNEISTAVLFLAMTFSFAISTAVFNRTYEDQSHVDAFLTNGADITVTALPGYSLADILAQLKSIPGVEAVDTMQHGFAYVGNDLQDFYGIDPAHIGDATVLSNAYFGNGDAKRSLAELAATPDGAFVSEETVNDFQLSQQDTLNLRLQAADGQYHVVPFRFIGVVREFPTAPRDSFVIANAAYVAAHTGAAGRNVALIKVSGEHAGVLAAVRDLLKGRSDLKVSDLRTVEQLIGSSLTAVDLRGLTKLELFVAILLIAGVCGLQLALGLAQRRKSFAVLSALGAKRRELVVMMGVEGMVTLGFGAVFGTLIGFAVAQMLVKLLTGVFDPPPDALSVPLPYLLTLGLAALISVTAAIFLSVRLADQEVAQTMRGM